MKRVLLFLMITGLATMVAFGQRKETRSASDFTGINASSVFNIIVSKGNTESLTIEADDNVMQYVRSEVKNGVLYLYIDNSKQFRNIKILKASIVMKNLDKVTLSGACKLTANDLFTPEKFKIDCSGASSMDVNLNTDILNIEASGASKIQIKAKVAGDTNLSISGASKIQGELKTANLELSSSGVCSVELSGSAINFKINMSGVSKIMTEDFIVRTANVKLSGSSKITVNATVTLKVNASGASSVSYKGSPALELNKSQAVKIRNI